MSTYPDPGSGAGGERLRPAGTEEMSCAGVTGRQVDVTARAGGLEAEGTARARGESTVVRGVADRDGLAVGAQHGVPVAGDLVAGRQGEGDAPAVHGRLAGVG